MTYTALKNAIQWLELYGYTRKPKTEHFTKTWSSKYSYCNFMVDLYELAMINYCAEDYLEDLEAKAKRVLKEMDV